MTDVEDHAAKEVSSGEVMEKGLAQDVEDHAAKEVSSGEVMEKGLAQDVEDHAAKEVSSREVMEKGLAQDVEKPMQIDTLKTVEKDRGGSKWWSLFCLRRRKKNRSVLLFEACDRDVCELEYLLNEGTTQPLGEGTFCTTLKLSQDGSHYAVKRIKRSSKQRSSFKAHMEIVRGLKHPNLLQLNAFYYTKLEAILVYDYIEKTSSVSSLLHENNEQHLDWKTRLLIAIGAAKGISRIHQEKDGRMVHGNIRSSNIFLNSNHQAVVSEFGLAAVLSPLTPTIALETGYCAPEITDASMSTQLADVYSFGVVLLELLTGKSAVLTSTRTGNCSLAQWIQVALKTEWTTDLIDPNLQRSVIIDSQILKLFRIALSCVEAVPDQRPNMSDLIPLMQKILHESDLV